MKRDDKVFLVIETKNIRSALNNNVKNQAANYATSLGADWAAITNGQVWKLFRVIPQKGTDPRIIEIFDVALLDDDGVSDEDAENLYLLTSRAVFSGDLEKSYHEVAGTSERRILKALESERVIKAIRMELVDSYKEENDYRLSLDDEYVGELVMNLYDPLEF